jgi:hypothetical protein
MPWSHALCVARGDGSRCRTSVHDTACGPLEPQTHAAVAGGKCNQDARLVPGAQQQVRGHRTRAQEAVDVVAFVDAKRSGAGLRHRRRSATSTQQERTPFHFISQPGSGAKMQEGATGAVVNCRT